VQPVPQQLEGRPALALPQAEPQGLELGPELEPQGLLALPLEEPQDSERRRGLLRVRQELQSAQVSQVLLERLLSHLCLHPIE
jgi:hypothetical protein